MAYGSGKRRVQAAWAAVVVCLATLGCRAQFTFRDDAPPAPTASTAALLPKIDPQPAHVAAPDQPVVLTAAKSSSPDAWLMVTPASKAAAREMGVAALTGKDLMLDPPPADPSDKNWTTTKDGSFRAVPHHAAEPQTIQRVGLSAHKDLDKPTDDKPVPEAAPKPPAVLPRIAGAVDEAAPNLPLPTEKAKTALPAYVIEPPDVLVIDAVRLIPKPPYRIETLDVLLIEVPNALPGQPITGPYTVTPDGTVNLGFGYGPFRVVGMTLADAAAAIRASLRVNNPQVSVALGQFRGIQQVRGEHIVSQDGTITLGSYGCVNVTGLTLSQAKCEIERHLGRWLQDPLISVSIGGYNSKVYYVITDGAGLGQQVYRFPITGNDTVLDAISLINGLPPVSSKHNIWLARPTPADHGCYQILPVNWQAITQAGSTDTNWQLFPGDRIYVKADPLITIDNELAKVLNPIERLFGATLLGSATVNSFRTTNGVSNSGF